MTGTIRRPVLCLEQREKQGKNTKEKQNRKKVKKQGKGKKIRKKTKNKES